MEPEGDGWLLAIRWQEPILGELKRPKLSVLDGFCDDPTYINVPFLRCPLTAAHSSVISASDEQLEIAISYAHRDQALKDELILHLSPLRRQGIIAHWHDRNIDAGDDWKQEIDTHFNTAGMILRW